ncbi:DUF885 domain-containing protein [Sphingosinicella sp. LY1275]|uniref:DUF885 domain-containing protein n=1 Tax=Sphingosinicella sp. LY1275 TaxID=3095379 RepID=UPI002ADEA787|nr:DUF885 domain-containing protein [Sphingosinicella sp. LY1275]MEA1015172.1 DUF885 domain-containing protein [Sphingosinicella sp. LY1275]
MKTLRLALLLAAAFVPAAAPAQQAAPAAAAQAQSEDARFLAFLDAAFDEAVARSPETQTALGLKTNYGKLDDYTDAGAAADQALAEAQLKRMKSEFPLDRLNPASQVSYRLFEYNVEQGRIAQEWRRNNYVVTNNFSIVGSVPTFLMNQHRIDSVADAQAYIARIRETERVLGEVTTRFRAAAERGIVPPKFVFAPVRTDAQNVMAGTSLLADFKTKVEKLDAPAATKAKLIADAQAAISGPYQNGYKTIIAALDAIEPKATGNQGVWSLPEGEAYYSAMLGLQTTTPLTGEQIHDIGLAEVARIHKEMQAIMDKIGFKGTLQQFFAELKTNPKYQYSNDAAGRAAYLKDAGAFVDQVMAVSGKYFRQLPKAKLEVRAVEEWRQTTAPIAFYNAPAPDGSRPGIYYVNLSDMRQVLKPQIEGISYHEGAPGHHFQIALAQELAGLPKFRRFGNYGAYAEGWGLYAERLGKEMGFYQDPISDFGRLSTELWRAVRLVLDSGMHAKKWTREQAIEYFKQNSLLSDRDVVKEVERFLVWPGQATSYKVGQLKILDLRAKAERELGPRFDLKDFHDVVLGMGPMPLAVLEQQVDAYIAAKKG